MSLLSKTMKISVENPCVGGSITPRATKKHQTHLRVVFHFATVSVRFYFLWMSLSRSKNAKLDPKKAKQMGSTAVMNDGARANQLR
jgi:hypothetical protein